MIADHWLYRKDFSSYQWCRCTSKMLNQQLNMKIIIPKIEDWLFAPKVLTLPSEPAARCRLQGNTPFSYNSSLILISFGWLHKDVGDQRLHFHPSSIFYEGPCLSVRRTKVLNLWCVSAKPQRFQGPSREDKLF